MQKLCFVSVDNRRMAGLFWLKRANSAAPKYHASVSGKRRNSDSDLETSAAHFGFAEFCEQAWTTAELLPAGTSSSFGSASSTWPSRKSRWPSMNELNSPGERS